MRMTVLGGSGAWPTADQPCSGYLVAYEGFLLLVDPGYAVFPRLLAHASAAAVDAVVVTHGHPDHCADLNPLLRARALGGDRLPPLPVYAPPGALDAVLALDRRGMLADAYALREFEPGDRFATGPFAVETVLLPHHLPDAGLRLTAGGRVLAYTGDTGPSPEIARLARGADLLVSEATYVDEVPEEDAGHLLTARLAGAYAHEAGVARLLLTHLWPGTDPAAALAAAGESYQGETAVAAPGLVADLPGGFSPTSGPPDGRA